MRPKTYQTCGDLADLLFGDESQWRVYCRGKRQVKAELPSTASLQLLGVVQPGDTVASLQRAVDPTTSRERVQQRGPRCSPPGSQSPVRQCPMMIIIMIDHSSNPVNTRAKGWGSAASSSAVDSVESRCTLKTPN